MSIKLIVADMDGTLLNEHAEISNQSVEAILAAQKSGVEFAVATGRTVNFGYSLVKEKGITCTFIELNGARLFNEQEELQFTREISKPDLTNLLDILKYFDIHTQFITQTGIYSKNSLNDHIESYKYVFKDVNKSLSDAQVKKYIMNHMNKNNIEIVESYDFLQEDPNTHVLKTLLRSPHDKNLLKKIRKEIEKELPSLIVTSASNVNLEINDIKANKGKAVADYAKIKGYKPSEIITIGDHLNDVTMLEWADHSYAVDNAHIKAKEAATYIAPSHDREPVAQIIDKVLSGKNLNFSFI